MNGGPSTHASVSSVVGSYQQVHYQTGSAPIRPKSSSSLHSSIGTVSLLMLPYQSATDPMTRLRKDRKSTRLNSSHRCISYAVFCLKKKKTTHNTQTITTHTPSTTLQ